MWFDQQVSAFEVQKLGGLATISGKRFVGYDRSMIAAKKPSQGWTPGMVRR